MLSALLQPILLSLLLLGSVTGFQPAASPNGRVVFDVNRQKSVTARPLSRQASSVSCGTLTRPAVSSRKNDRTRLFMSETSTDYEEFKYIKRRDRVVIGYRAASIGYLISASAAFLSYTVSGAPLTSGILLASGPIVASGIAFILGEAASANRLKSDTYKRLTLILTKYGVYGLLVAMLVPSLRRPFWIGSSALAIVNGVKGYAYAVMGWKLEGEKKEALTADMVELVRSTCQRLVTPPANLQSAGYMASTVMLATLTVAKFVNILAFLVSAPAAPVTAVVSSADGAAAVATEATTRVVSKALTVGTGIARMARLTLLSGIALTLKDAADRERLEGTTFIELNGLSTFALGSIAAYELYSKSGPTSAVGMASAFFAALSAYNGINSVLKKKRGKA